MDFGNYAILDNHRHTFEKEPDWYWDIRPPTASEELTLARFLFSSDKPPLPIEIAMKEVALSFGGTNIPVGKTSVESGGDPLVKVGAPLENIEMVVQSMPSEMLYEIWEAVGEAVPFWGPTKEDAPKDQEPEAGGEESEEDNS